LLKPSLQLKLGQQLTMTPQLQQAIRLLQLPVMELQTHIQEALETNVMLDVEEPSADSTAEQSNGSAVAEEAASSENDFNEIEANWSDRNITAGMDSGYNPGEPRPERELEDLSGDSLRDHLSWQLEMERLDPRKHMMGQAIIDAINEDGYLEGSLEDIRNTLLPDLDAGIDQLEAVLMLVQKFDPSGVGARDLGECIRLQLRQLDPETPGLTTAIGIAKNHLELVAQQQFAALRRKLHCTDDELDHAILLVRGCHPRPGSTIGKGRTEYVIPDVYVRKIDNRWLVEVNSGIAPRLCVNATYAGAIGRGTDHTVLRTQLQEARWLVRSLEIRDETLVKVARCIVGKQQDFLDHGEVAMRPLVLREVAEEIGMHESTISRVSANKYMHTPRGIFEFRFFFSSHVSGDDGNEHSAVEVRARIKQMIGQENPKKPLSDNKIAKALSTDGIQVARRTVAKYREAMSIPPSSERKQLASC
jgi:RNA polymerase sigma-54 factor